MGAGSSGPGWGNGKATAVLFAREGAKVVCADIDAKAAAETVNLIEAEGGSGVSRRCDVTQHAAVKATVSAVVEAYGQIDILHNNVGIAQTGGVVDVDDAVWDRVLQVNLKGAFLTMKEAIPHMRQQGGGAIINISSIAAVRHIGIPYASYYASKAALTHLTRATAVEEAAAKIRCNAILPGLMRTPMVEHSVGLAESYAEGDIEAMWRKRDAQVPMGHMGDAWDVARAALFLASDEARYITGIELVVDGGLTLKVS
jgi:NAD(P)-dependent dehydrogenase (short-subunit alcohol dehydrogenase family)